MNTVIEVFRSDAYVPDGVIPLAPVLHEVFGEIIGPDPAGISFDLVFDPQSDPSHFPGEPSLVNLRAGDGYVRVRISRNDELLYERVHPVRELVAPRLRELLRSRDPAVDHWGYKLTSPGPGAAAGERPAPRLRHEMRAAHRPRRRTTFTMEAVPEPPLPATSLAALGAGAEPAVTGPHPVVRPSEAAPPVAIAVPAGIVSQLVETTPFSAVLEEGGFLTGNVFSDINRPGGYVVKVTALVPAERTGASSATFTFTGESFLRINDRIASANKRIPPGIPKEMLLGWYHTHLFSASGSGLSMTDVDLHKSTFRRPWQLAALINISGDGRVLRFYHGEHDPMTKIPHWLVRS
jgi:JAB N-terminal domain